MRPHSSRSRKHMKMKLERTKHIPKELEQGVLYVSEEFEFAAHLCPCGCGSIIRTPLGPTEWEFTDTKSGPTLFPSIGNWQQPCRSHYWITNGNIRWAPQWTNEEILEGRQREEQRRQAYYDSLYADEKPGILSNIWNWIKGIFGK